MFSTTEAMRSEALTRLYGVHVWDAVELELSVPFLLISTRDADAPGLTRTFLVHARGFEGLLQERTIAVQSAALATPPGWNRSSTWRLEGLLEAWRTDARHCARYGRYGWLFKVEGGEEYDSVREARRRSSLRGLVRIYPPRDVSY